MSRKSNTLGRNTPKSPSLKPKIYQDKFDDKFCTIFFKNHPEYLDLRTPTEKIKCLQELLATDLEPGERFVALSQIVILQNLLHGGKSVENLRAEAELGFFYNENVSPIQALKHLDKAHSLEKTNKIEIEESIKIAVEIAKAHLLLKSKGKSHLQQAKRILQPYYYYSSISDIQLRFDRDLTRSRIFSAEKNYEIALESYEDARLTLREIYDDNDSKPEAELYLEMAKMLEHARTIPEHKEKAEEYYMKAHQMFVDIGNEEDADKIDLYKLPYDYRIEVMKRKGIYKEGHDNDYDIHYSTDTNTEYETDTIYDIEYETDIEYEIEIDNIEPSSELDLEKASLNNENKNSDAEGKTESQNENQDNNENQSQNGSINASQNEDQSQKGETHQTNTDNQSQNSNENASQNGETKQDNPDNGRQNGN